MTRITVFILISVFAIACTSKKSTPAGVNSFSEIKFGSRGGFTGMGKEYVVRHDGNVFSVAKDSLVLLHQIGKSEIDSIERYVQTLNFKDIKFLETGNMTYHIEIHAAEYQNRVTWTDQSDADKIKNLYKTLVKTVKKQ